jgi:hypothetical protein
METLPEWAPVFLVIGTVDGALLVLYCPIDDLEERREIDHWFADLRGCTRKACSASLSWG